MSYVKIEEKFNEVVDRLAALELEVDHVMEEVNETLTEFAGSSVRIRRCRTYGMENDWKNTFIKDVMVSENVKGVLGTAEGVLPHVMTAGELTPDPSQAKRLSAFATFIRRLGKTFEGRYHNLS